MLYITQHTAMYSILLSYAVLSNLPDKALSKACSVLPNVPGLCTCSSALHSRAIPAFRTCFSCMQ